MDSGRAKTSAIIVALVVTLLPLLYFFPATGGHLIISPDDGVIQNIPFRVAAANELRGGFIPLWNPWLFCGMPMLAGAQVGLLFPLNWFYLTFAPALATNLMMLSAYMLAALGAYLYSRRIGSSIAGAALTSIVWQGSGFLVNQIGHTNIVHTAALLPWLLWAIEGFGQTASRRRGFVLAIIVALQCFAGHQQTFVYGILLAAAYAVVMWRAERTRGYFLSLVLIGAGLALAAIQIFPSLELLRHSLRADASYDFFTSFSMPRRFILTFVAPYLMGGGDGSLFRAPYIGPSFYAEYVAYVGLGSLALALFAVAFKRDARALFWVAVAGIALLLALGRYAPLNFYRPIYGVPVLNLFRVPARHLMEAEFALAVLAGRGLTAVQFAPDRARVVRWIATSAGIVLLLTCVVVTIGRPADFRLGRDVPVTILRAPELFLPAAVALLTALALYWTARRATTAASFVLIVVCYFDLNMWGQFSGWRKSSPTVDSEIWTEPPAFKALKARAVANPATPYRVLTQDHAFDPDQRVSYAEPVEAWLLPLQADIAMMWGWESAAGYEGFGLARYSQLAGNMKIWGDLTDPEHTLRGESRELDLLNVRYLLVRSPTAPKTKAAGAVPENAAMEDYGGHKFARENLGLPAIAAGQRVSFTVPPAQTQNVALTTTLAWSENVPDGTVVAHVELQTNDGRHFDFDLRAGDHTSEWAYDRAEVRERIKHKRAPVATSYPVKDAQPFFEGHDYICAFDLATSAVIIGGEIAVASVPDAPQLSLNVGRISLSDGHRVVPVQKDMVTIARSRASPLARSAAPRWTHLADVGPVSIFENNRVLPRAWLVTRERVATDEQQLQIIRSGKISVETKWDPMAEALVERATGVASPAEKARPATAQIVRHEPNRVEIATDAETPALLVLAENYYPGWRAIVDGRRRAILRADYNLRAVAVPAGRHNVVFSYQPRSALLGLIVSAVSLGLLLWWMNTQARVKQP